MTETQRTCNGCKSQPICKTYEAAKVLYATIVSAKAESFRQELHKLVAESCHIFSPIENPKK